MLQGGALFLSACHGLSEVRASRTLIETPHPDAWHPVLRALIPTVLPFEHPAFPPVTVDALFDELEQLFPIESDPAFAALPKALMLFDDCPLFETAPPPFVDDQRVDLAESRVPAAAIDVAVEQAQAYERALWQAYTARFGSARFTAQPLPAQRAYLALYSHSELVARRRFYRGMKALVTITAYSTTPFWKAVGYEGPLLRRG